MKINILIIAFLIMSFVALPCSYAQDDEEKPNYGIIKNPDKEKIEQKLFFPKKREITGYYKDGEFLEYSFMEQSGPIFQEVAPLWFSTVLTAGITDEAVFDDIANQIINNGVVLNENGQEVAHQTAEGGLIVTPDNVIIGGFLEPVYAFDRGLLKAGEKYLGYINKNCFVIVRNEQTQVTYYPDYSGEYSQNPKYAVFDYGPVSNELDILRPLIAKDGSILGWVRNNGFVYDEKGNVLAMGPQCETIVIEDK